MNKKEFRGIYPALVTPFDANGEIAVKPLQKLIETNIKKGVSGFYVAGSTGESYMLTMAERKYLLEAVMDAVDGRADVIVHAGMFAEKQTIELAQHAEKCGAAAVSSVPPFYFPFTMEEYEVYYKEIAENTGIPVIVYNIPDMSSVHFSESDMSELLAIDGIGGMKHTSYDLFQLERLIRLWPEKNFFCGHDEIFLSALSAGADAGIGTSFNFMAEKFIELRRLYRSNRIREAQVLQAEANDIISVLCKVSVFKGTKEILKLQGIDCGECRKPFLPLDEAARQLVKETAEKYHLI